MNINKTIKEIIKPRFTIWEMETAGTRCNCEYTVITLYFNDNKPNFPTGSKGRIDTGQGFSLTASWNMYGECFVSGKRINSFDLVRPQDKELIAAKPFIEFCIILIIVILGSSIF